MADLLYEAFERAFSECTDDELFALFAMMLSELVERSMHRDNAAAQEPEPSDEVDH